MNRRIEKRILLLFLTWLIVGCATKRDFRFIELPDRINDSPAMNLTKEQVEYDREQLHYALQNAYSGKHHLPNGEHSRLTEKVENLKGPTAVGAFCENIGSFLNEVSDNHLNASLNQENCFKQKPNRPGTVGKNFFPKGKTPWSVQHRKFKGANALLISITGFTSSTNPVWNGFLDAVKQNLAKAQFIIIDLRGNGGGDDRTGRELSYLLAGVHLKNPNKPQWNNTKPEAFQLFVNRFEYWIRLTKEKGKPVPKYLMDLKEDFVSKRDRAAKGEPVSLDESEGTEVFEDFDLAKSVQKPIYILMDADCGSSCESTIDAFEYNPLVKTVGENTSGYVHFGNNGLVILKNSGVEIQMAMSYNSYVDGRFVEKKGLTPKIKVPSGADAMKYATKDYFLNLRKSNSQ
jgi:hypothetical protein